MTDDPHRDPTRTEDVEEADTEFAPDLPTWFEELAKVVENEEVHTLPPAETLREAGEYVSELEKERDKYREQRDFRDEQRRKAVIAYEDERRDARAARRRVDRLEEEAREVERLLRRYADLPLGESPQRSALEGLADRLRSALDSREGEVKGPNDCLCTWELVSPADSSHDRTRRVETHPDCPAHADEPEGDESNYGDGFVDGVAWAADQYDERAPFSWDDAVKASYEKSLVCERCGASTSKGRWEGGPVLCRSCRPTDEPVSREGVYDEVRAERRRQDEEWGSPEKRTHLSATDLSAIVAEEAGELAEAALESDFAGSQSSEKGMDLRQEAIQVAASGVLVAEILDAGGPLDDGSTATHADEPEGDEADTRAKPGPPRCDSDSDGYSRCDRRAGHDGPHRDYFGKEWPTDEPVSREGDKVIIACSNCDTVYPFGWEHACGEGGKLYVRRPEGRSWWWAGDELKRCPRCGEHALEGQAECFNCGMEPEDDTTWRQTRSRYLERHHSAEPPSAPTHADAHSGEGERDG